ncbi:MAG: hypothetical protein ABIG30_02345 [Candidatus Aenigmatarchaeota archaeon]
MANKKGEDATMITYVCVANVCRPGPYCTKFICPTIKPPTEADLRTIGDASRFARTEPRTAGGYFGKA